VGAAAVVLMGVGVPLAGLAGGWARNGCAAVDMRRLSKAGRVTGWVFYASGMTLGLGGTMMGFAEVPWGGEIVGGIGLILGIGALVLLQIDAHVHLRLLAEGIHRAKRLSTEAPPGDRGPVVLVVPWTGAPDQPAAGAAVISRW